MRSALLAGAIALIGCTDTQARTARRGDASVADATPVAPAAGAIRLEQVGDRFRSPVHLTSPPGDARLFVVEQAGRIRIVKNGAIVAQPFLDMVERVRSGGEQGLLSVAFHPDYARNGWFYVNYTDRQGDTRVERYKVSSNPDLADASSAKLVLGIDQPYSNHNGGLAMFGPDGMLWIGTGDGGSGGDPHGNGQNRQALLGKMLRINVSGADPYTIPADNPYANGSGGKPEIWAIGLRNPWRFAFDRPAGLLYIADVGQNAIEEIHIERSNKAGLDYGWNIMEGDQCYGRASCNRSGLEIPQVTYRHAGGACSITGGFVYRGRRIPSITGHYFYSDYCAGWLRSFRFQNGAVTDRREWKMDDIGHVVSFGEDSAGEMLIISENGRIFRFAGSG
ncbi:MAG: PQQ-dependent sugar dehydrogenase [Gemmatimonadaceae bacterium]|nr:PQQ-dependent sugar dehydrogenase [Gemmatimonadaceae bacterium]